MRQRLAYVGFSAIGVLIGLIVNAELTPLVALGFAAVQGLPYLRRWSAKGHLVADGRTLIAPLTLWHPVALACLLGFTISQARSSFGHHEFGGSALRVLGVLFVVTAAFTGLFVVAMVVRPPVLRLTPEGIEQGSLGRRLLRWDDLPGAVSVQGGKSRALQTILLTRRRAIAATMLGMEAERFAAVVEYYRTHPEHRAAIGTAAEYDRLFRAAS